jgi:hypothetical protein
MATAQRPKGCPNPGDPCPMLFDRTLDIALPLA